MSQEKVKKIFIICLLVLPLQYVLVGVALVEKREPWPALVLPSFRSVFAQEDDISVDHIKFYVQNKENAKLIEIQPDTLFEDINKSQLQGFYRAHFSDSLIVSSLSAKTKQWLKDQINMSYPLLKPEILHIKWKKKIFDSPPVDSAHYTTKTVNHYSISL